MPWRRSAGAIISLASGVAAAYHFMGMSSWDYFWLFGTSMQPTFGCKPGVDVVVWINRSLPSPLRVGDVVIARHPRDPTRRICKRVAAVGGDEVVWCDHSLGSRNEGGNSSSSSSGDLDYCTDCEAAGGVLRSLVVDAESVFLVGDNPETSVDSRSFGPCPTAHVEALVIAVLIPSFGWVSSDPSRVARFLRQAKPTASDESSAVSMLTQTAAAAAADSLHL